MSLLLKTLVEQFAPETVKVQLQEIDLAAKRERTARHERQQRTKWLLDTLPTKPKTPAVAMPAMPTVEILR